jgi:phosphate transport system substrate-binding protein
MRVLHRLLPLCSAALLFACAVPPTSNTVPAASALDHVAEPVVPGSEGKLPGYRRLDKLQGTVQLSGSSAVATFARAWGSAFQRIYPNAAVNVASKSTGAAVVDMAANPAIIGMMSRAMSAAERENYVRQHGQPPLEFKVAIDAVAIFVFKDNPLKSISIAELERVYAANPKNGAAIDRWEQIGLGGEWAKRTVNTIGFEAGRGAYDLMRELVLRGGSFNADVAAEPVSTSVVQAVGVDPGAIGYASVYYHTARTRIVPLQTASGELTEPTEADASSGKYPLARYLYLYLATPKGGATDSAAREFLRFVLSEEGQAVTRSSGAFAIPAALARSQRAALAKQ